MSVRRFAFAVAFLSAAAGPVMAQECATDVKTQIEQVRKMYVEGAGGVANSNYSSRSGSYAQMACLDRFLKGDMDIFFRPPDLNTLMQQVVSFACDKIEEAVGGGGGGGFDSISAFSGISSGGLTLPSVGDTTFSDTLSLSRVIGR